MKKQKQRKHTRLKLRRQTMLCLFLMASLLFGITGPQQSVKAAAEVTVHIMQGDLGHAINRTMRSGEERSGWEIELNQGRTVKKATWKTSDSSVVTVNGNKNGATVTAHKEGTAVLSLTVETDHDETVSDECLISSVTTLETSRQAAGYIKSTADLHRGARTTSKVRNTAPKGQKLTVIALCGSFYRVRLPESFDFNDTLNQDTAYVLKTKVEIPAISVSITNAGSIRNLKVGDKVKAVSSVLPDLTTSKELAWKSSDETVAAVDTDGSITAKKAGTATITLTEKNSEKKSSVTITVSDILAASLTITNAEELKRLSVGSTATAKVSMTPANISKKKLTWKSSNTRVASVDQNGSIRVLAGGSAVITVAEQYSGLTASISIGVGYSLGAAKKGKSKPTIKLKKSTDFRGNTITWNKISGAKYYRIYVEHWSTDKKNYIQIYKKGKKIKTTTYYDRNVTKNQKCRYRVVAYNAKNKALTLRKNKAKKVTVKTTAPDLSVSVGQLGKLKLDWKQGSAKKRKGIQGYKIYRSTREKGKYTLVKQIKKKNTLSWTDTKLAGGTTYYYRIRTYGKQKKKTVTGAYSDIKSACTISEKINWDYYNKKKSVWQGVCMEKKSITEKQSTDRMRNYTVKKDGVDTSPYIKYHLTTDTLYIHVYVRFYTFNRKTGKETAAPKTKGTYAADPDKRGGSYRDEFVRGVTSTFSTFIQGSKYDFAEGVTFHTKLVLHDKDQGSYPKAQEFLGVSIGGDCDCNYCLRYIPSQINASSNYWFHAAPCSAGCVFSHINRIHIPDNTYLLNKKERQPMESVLNFRSSCGHEMGHILGLGDGYNDKDNISGKYIDRMTYSTETCLYRKKKWYNLMLQPRDYSMIRPNDMEMMLLAYGLSFDPNQTWISLLQYYKTHDWDGYERIISTVIKKGKKENEK